MDVEKALAVIEELREAIPGCAAIVLHEDQHHLPAKRHGKRGEGPEEYNKGKESKTRKWQSAVSGDNAAVFTATTCKRIQQQQGRCNLAEVLASDYIAIDVDHPNGFKTLAKLEALYGKLPDTLTQKTWSGGLHLLYQRPAGVKLTTGQNLFAELAPVDENGERKSGIDLKSEASYIVVEPSTYDQQPYRFERDENGKLPPVAELPKAWAEAFLNQGKGGKPARSTTNSATAPVVGGTSPDGKSPWSIENSKCKELIENLPPDARDYPDILRHCDYDDRGVWLKALQVINYELSPANIGGDGTTARNLSKWFSIQSAKYPGDEALRKLIDGFHPVADGREPIGKGTLIEMARENGYQSSSERQQAQEAQHPSFIHINERCVFDDGAGKVYRTDEKRYMNDRDEPHNLFDRLAPIPVKSGSKGDLKLMPAYEVWRKSPNARCVKDIIFAPGMPEEIEVLGKGKCLNTWKDESLGAVEGDVTPFLSLVGALCRENEELIEWLLQWMAHTVQYPGRKIHSAPLLVGAPAAGKSTLAAIMSAVVGAKYSEQIGGDEFFYKTTFFKDKVFVVVDEVCFRTFKDSNAVLKRLITEPTVRYEEKYQPRRTIANTVNFMFTSNRKDALPIEGAERRVCVIDVPPTDAGKAAAEWLLDKKRVPIPERVSAVRHYLKYRVDLTNFDPSAEPPMTEAKEELALLNQTDAENVVSGFIEDVKRNRESELWTRKDIITRINLPRKHGLTEGAINRALSNLIPQSSRKKVDLAGDGDRVWIFPVYNQNKWAAATPQAWRDEYNRSQSGTPYMSAAPLNSNAKPRLVHNG